MKSILFSVFLFAVSVSVSLLLLVVSPSVTVAELVPGSRTAFSHLRRFQQRSSSSSSSSSSPFKKKKPQTPTELLNLQNFSGQASFYQPAGVSWLDKTFGFTNARYKVPFPDQKKTPARFPIASNTKLYVAISLYQLHEKNIIKSMDDDIADYISAQDMQSFGVPNQKKYCPQVTTQQQEQQQKKKQTSLTSTCEKITFRQLLDMTAGIQDTNYQFLPFPGSLAKVVGRFIQAPLLFTPGEKYYYSNPSFELSSWFIEKFSGLKFEEYLYQNIFSVVPNGGLSTRFPVYDDKFGVEEGRVSEFYEFIVPEDDPSKSILGIPTEFVLGTASGAGGLIATQEDERKLYYYLFNFSSGGPTQKNPTVYPNKLLSSHSVLELIKCRTYISNNFYYGQGLFLISSHNQTALPDQIVYEGEIMCSHTSNVYDLLYDPPVMAQVWSHQIVFYPTKEEWEMVHKNSFANGTFWEVTRSWQVQAPLQELSFAIIKMFMNQ